MANLLARKSLDVLLKESEETGERTLKRALGPINLVSLGIGAIIGAGIFVLTGEAAAQYAGPAIVLSFILAGLACAFAGLCYAEFASLIPIAGSAYTYGYATLGGDFRVDHRLGSYPGVCVWRGDRGLRMERLRTQLPAGFWNTHSAPDLQRERTTARFLQRPLGEIRPH